MARLSDETNGIHMGFKRTVVGILWDYMGISCCSAKKTLCYMVYHGCIGRHKQSGFTITPLILLHTNTQKKWLNLQYYTMDASAWCDQHCSSINTIQETMSSLKSRNVMFFFQHHFRPTDKNQYTSIYIAHTTYTQRTQEFHPISLQGGAPQNPPDMFVGLHSPQKNSFGISETRLSI